MFETSCHGRPYAHLIWVVGLAWMTLVFGGGTVVAFAEEAPVALAESPRNSVRLPLVHTAEVQAELGLDGEVSAKFLEELRRIDAEWWPARNLSSEKNAEVVARLERELLEVLNRLVGEVAVERLSQLELQAQGLRGLVRDDVAETLQLSSQQQQRLRETFGETDRQLAEHLQSNQTPSKQATMTLVNERRIHEGEVANRLLSNQQKQQIQRQMGKPLDTSQFERTFPLAPRLIDTNEWVSDSVAPDELDGQVVLLHFYAFQCHNCVANFPHYRRWHAELSRKGVVVIGIQTPETSAERDVERVREAARDEELNFPILIDLQNKNWDAWGNTMWPTVYVIDRKGYIRGWWQGELNWNGATGDETIEGLVDALLAEKG